MSAAGLNKVDEMLWKVSPTMVRRVSICGSERVVPFVCRFWGQRPRLRAMLRFVIIPTTTAPIS
jgi:hypothetical protein